MRFSHVMKNQKGFIVPILIIISLLILAIIAYFFSPKSLSLVNVKLPTASPTSEAAFSNQDTNWKTYTNTQYKFSFQYPANLKMFEYDALKELGFNEDETSVFYTVYLQNYGTADTGISDTDFQTVINVSKNEFKELVDNITVDRIPTKYRSFTTLDGQNAFRISSGTKFDYPYAIISKNGYLFTITWSNSGKTEINEKSFDQILSTFKFIE